MGVQRDLYSPKLPELDLAIDTEYAADLLNVNMWL